MKKIFESIFKLNYLVLLLALPSLILGWIGLDRVYYSVPDQDLLWASESFRLFRGIGPSYADHPGAYWPISYLIKLFWFSKFELQEILNQDGLASIMIVEKLIRSSRIESAIISGMIPIIFFFLLRSFNIKKELSLISSVILSLSSALLNGVSSIRHEQIGVLFMLIYLLLTSIEIRKPTTARNKIIRSLYPNIFFFASIYCKQQILLLAPLVLLSIIQMIRAQSNIAFSKIKELFTFSRFNNSVIILFCSAIPWAILALPDFDLINLPFWILINTTLILPIWFVYDESLGKRGWVKSLFSLTLLETIIFKFLSPTFWRQAVTGFPSWIFIYAQSSEERISDFIASLQRYSFDLMGIEDLGLIIFIALTLVRILSYTTNVFSNRTNKTPNLSDIALVSLFLLLIAFSLRPSQHYQIYLFIPIMLMSSISLTHVNKISDMKSFNMMSKNFLAYIAIIVISFSFFKSVANTFALKGFIYYEKNSEALCYTQHMDSSMQNTPAGQCSTFTEAALKKTRFDSWGSPKWD